MKWYPWLRAPFEQLISQYQAGRGHHALLVHSLPGMGEDALIYALCRWLMCQRPQGNKSCGECHSCQLMQAGTHPDSYEVTLEKGKSTLGIDVIREITEKLYSHSQQGGNKVIRIAQADKLTEAAANALLKTLEEPPARTWFFLSCPEPAHLPATLRSRCLSWHLAPPAESFARAWLARETQQTADSLTAALRLSGGSPPAALQLLEPVLWKQREKLTDSLSLACDSGDMLALLPEFNHDDAVRTLDWLCALLLDAIKHQQGATNGLTNNDHLSLVIKLTQQGSPALLHSLLHIWFQCRATLLNVVGVNRELILTETLLTWERLMQPGSMLPSHPI